MGAFVTRRPVAGKQYILPMLVRIFFPTIVKMIVVIETFIKEN